MLQNLCKTVWNNLDSMETTCKLLFKGFQNLDSQITSLLLQRRGVSKYPELSVTDLEPLHSMDGLKCLESQITPKYTLNN